MHCLMFIRKGSRYKTKYQVVRCKKNVFMQGSMKQLHVLLVKKKMSRSDSYVSSSYKENYKV